jgi:ribose transport system permease protein
LNKGENMSTVEPGITKKRRAGASLGLGGLRQLAGLALICLAAIFLSPRERDTNLIIFLTQANLTDIVRQVSENGIIALGMTFVILTGGIDLSVGSMLALSSTFAAKLLVQWTTTGDWTTHIAIIIGLTLMMAATFGALMGFAISKLKVQPFIITLAGMIGLRGFARFLTDNANIDIGFGVDITAAFSNGISQKPVVMLTFALLAVIFYVILSRTVFGLQVRSIGDNLTASRYAGLPVTRTIVVTYAISGFLVGMAGILHAAQNHQGNPNDGVNYELDAIAAVVIGGTNMSGGKGTIFGTIVGVFILGVITNMFRLKGVDINVEMMCKAVIIVLAVWLQMPRVKK